MITIKGNYQEAVVFSSALDTGSEGIITALCNSIIAENSKIRIMPDVHPGKGCAIGLTMTIEKRIAPGLIGVDIGCGMYAVKFKAKKLELQKLDKLIHSNIPSGFNIRREPHRFSNRVELNTLKCAKHIRTDKSVLGIGTLGGGNHFIEIDKCADGYYLIIHSGSRHLGVEVERHYHELAYKNSNNDVPYEFAYLEGLPLSDYLHDMKIVQNFALVNREAIADTIIKGMKLDAVESFHTTHNYIDTDKLILRKGAINAHLDEKIIIPLNMRDGCLICKGKGNEDWNFSAPHGAGRAFNRADTLSSFTLSQYKKEMKNVYSSTIDRDTLDECPMAYKDSESIINAITPTAEITEHINPIYNFKAGRKSGE